MENWHWTNAKLCDVANLVLGAVLFASPWIFGFDAGKISQNANITGLVIAILAIAALAAFAVWGSKLHGTDAAIDMLLPLAAVAFGLTAIGIVFLIAAATAP